VNDAPEITVVAHDRGAYDFTMKSTATGALHRVLPLRDPEQPRFWCVVVVRCEPNGLLDPSVPPWIGRRGLHREELGETMAAIRADLPAWLAQPAQAQLQASILASGGEPVGTRAASEPPGPGSAGPLAARAGEPPVQEGQRASHAEPPGSR
jgi:hypothetical protein